MRLARGRALVAAGADIVDVGGESARGDRPAVSADEEIARVEELVARAGRATACWCRWTPTSPRSPRRRSRRGRRSSTTSRGCATRRWPTLCARTGAALVLMHTRVAPKGTLLDPATYDDVVADVVAFLRERIAVARVGGHVASEQLILDPGPDFAKTPAQTVAVLRRLDALRALGRPLLLAASRKDFVGAITGRAPAERDAGTLAALGVRGRRGRRDPARARRRGRRRLPRRARRPARRARAGAARRADAGALPRRRSRRISR